ncbi:MAG: hypothetical protein JXL80_02735 [Planctomycetes bacterium]|nr:hypothetical protein [Planctomycetota bacterium]
MTLSCLAAQILAGPLGQAVSSAPVEVLETRYELRPVLPVPLVAAGIILAGIIVAWIHTRPRLELHRRWRITLGMLRIAALTVPAILLLQPERIASLRRSEPRNITFLMDASGSMALADEPEPRPSTRWQRMIQALDPIAASYRAMDPADRPHLDLVRFDTRLAQPGAPPPDAGQPPAGGNHTAIGTALQSAADRLSDSPGSHLILLTDGADTASPPDAHPRDVARRLARSGLAVNTCLVGRERPRNLAATLATDAPFAFIGDPITLRVQLEHQDIDNQIATVALLEDDRRLATRDIPLPAAGESITERFEIIPDRAGRHRYRAVVEPVPGELVTTDNAAVADVRVVTEPIRALYIEHWPRWQYRLLRNALRRDSRFETTFVLITEDPATPPAERLTARFPESAEVMSQYDVIIVGDVSPQDLSPVQWGWLVEHVTDHGAGIVLIAGPEHMPADFLDTPLAPLLPMQRTTSVLPEDVHPFHPRLTPLGRLHPLMRLGFGADAEAVWRELPPLQWYAGLADVKPGAMVLADRPPAVAEEPIPLVLLQRVGRGTAIFVGTDETWRWRYEHGNRYFYGFWAQVMQHAGLAHRVGEFSTVRIDTPATVSTGLPVPVTAAVDARSAAGDGTRLETMLLVAEPLEGLATPATVTLTASPDAVGIFAGHLRLDQPGRYRLYLEGYPDQGDAVIDVTSDSAGDPERASAAADPHLLRQIAALTGGEFVRLEELADLVDRLDLAPLRYDWTERTPLWDGWLTLAAFAALLTAEWTLRKWRYLP